MFGFTGKKLDAVNWRKNICKNTEIFSLKFKAFFKRMFEKLWDDFHYILKYVMTSFHKDIWNTGIV